jgi:hypothetical protein
MSTAEGNLNFRSTLDDSQFQAAIGRMEVNIGSMTDQITNQNGELETFAKKATDVANGFFSFENVAAFLSSVVQVRNEYQQLDITFSTILKSKNAADALMKDISSFAGTTPFGLTESADAAKQLLNYGSTAREVVKELNLLGNVAAGVSVPINELAGIYGNLKKQGTASEDDINQLASRGIPIYEELASVLNVGTDQITALVAAGQVGFPQVETAFRQLTNSGGAFYDLMELKSGTLGSELERLQGAWDAMLNYIGEGNEGVFSGSIAAAATLVENYEIILETLEILVITYGVYRAAIIANTLATNGITAAQMLYNGAVFIATQYQRILNAVAQANPYIAVATALGGLIAALVVFSDTSSEAARSLQEINEEASTNFDVEKNKLNQLLEVAREETLSKELRGKAISDINQLSPEHLGNLTLEKIKTNEAKAAIDGYLRSLEKSIRLKIANEKLEKLIREENEGAGFIDTVVGIGQYGLISGSDIADNLARVENKKAQEAVKAEIRAINKEISDAPQETAIRTISTIEAEIANYRKLQKTVAETSAQYKNYHKEIIKLEKEKRQITGESGPKANSRSTNKDKILSEVLGLEKQAAESGKPEDEDKIRAAQKNAENLRKRANAEKLSTGVLDRIDKAENKIVGQLKVEKETSDLKSNLESQKSMYAEYEAFKTKVGTLEADKRYASVIKDFKDYESYLKSKKDKLAEKPVGDRTEGYQKQMDVLSKEENALAKQKKDQEAERFIKAYKAAETTAQKLIAIEQEYQDDLNALKDKNGAVDPEQKKNLENIRDASINATKEEAFQKGEIYKKLSEDTLILTREQIKKQIVIMRSLLDDPSISASVKTGVQTKLDGLEKRLSGGVDQSNLEELKAKKAGINENLDHRLNKDKKVKDPNNDAEIKKLQGELEEVEGKINAINTKGLKGFMDSLKDNKALQGLSTGLGLASDAASMMSQALGGVDTEAGYTMNTIGQLAGAAGDLAGSIVSGDPVKIVGSAIKAVGTLFSIGKRVREMNEKARKEVADFYSNAIKGERDYQESLKERALQRVRENKTALNGIKDELKIRQDQMAGWKQESEEIMGKLSGMSSIASETYKHGTWFRKAKVIKTYESLDGKDYGQLSQLLSQGKLEGDAKALVERLKELEQKGFDAEKAIADLAKQTNEIFTGTTSDNLANSLLGMFKEGKTGAQDLADFFKQTMDDAALSIFKNKILAGAMDNFYKEFAKRGVSGEELTGTEISELEGIFNNSMANAAKEYEALKKITGRDPSSGGAGPSGLTGASSIKREITEETAGVLTGLWRGQFDLTKQLVTLSMERNAVVNTVGINAMQLLSVARSNFDVALKIESNTSRTANNTDGISGKLDQIIVNTQPSMGTRSLG